MNDEIVSDCTYISSLPFTKRQARETSVQCSSKWSSYSRVQQPISNFHRRVATTTAAAPWDPPQVCSWNIQENTTPFFCYVHIAQPQYWSGCSNCHGWRLQCSQNTEWKVTKTRDRTRQRLMNDSKHFSHQFYIYIYNHFLLFIDHNSWHCFGDFPENVHTVCPC